MKTNIRHEDGLWIVETNNRVIPVEHWDTALRIAAGPTGKERKCRKCGDPISRDAYRPVGVKAENRAGYCYACGKTLEPSVRNSWAGKKCRGGCGVTLHTHSGLGRGPGTMVHQARGFCSTCHARDKSGLPMPSDPDYECVRCGRDVSTSTRPPVGVAQVGSGGRCKPCAAAVAQGLPEVLDKDLTGAVRAANPGPMCAGDCGAVLCSCRAPITQGSRRHFKGGFCQPCYTVAGQVDLEDTTAPVAPELSAMMRARKARQEKQARVEKARAVEYARYLHYKKTRTPA